MQERISERENLILLMRFKLEDYRIYALEKEGLTT